MSMISQIISILPYDCQRTGTRNITLANSIDVIVSIHRNIHSVIPCCSGFVIKFKPFQRTGRIDFTGKYFGSLIVVIIALIPTIIYIFSIQQLSSNEGIDTGATIGSYIGLFFLASVFTAIGICCSSFTNNAVVAFIISLIGCALLYYGFSAISHLPALANGVDYYVEMLGIDFHYRSISRGLIDTSDVIYFLSVIFLFFTVTNRNLLKR